MTLKIIEKLNKNNIRCTLLTKGIYPKTFDKIDKYGKFNEYGITIVSLNNKFKKEFEPYSAPYNARIKSLKYLHNKGLKTWVSIEPYPTSNIDNNQNLSKLLDKINFVDRIIFGKLNYNVKSSKFANNGNFYELCANKVMDFCKIRNIDCHIKFGTQRKYNKITETIFKDKSLIQMNKSTKIEPLKCYPK